MHVKDRAGLSAGAVRHERVVQTWPPVSGLPRTFCCPKKPCGDRMTTLNPMGSLPKNACTMAQPSVLMFKYL